MQSNIPASSAGVVLGAQQLKVLRNTYLLLALTMVPTIIGAFVGMATSGIVFKHPIMSSLIMLGAVIGIQYAIAANRNSALGAGLLLGMTFILGWWMVVMSAIATTSKRDFSFMGKFLFVGMIVLIVAMFANMFLQIPALALTISALAIGVFSMFLLHDVSRIVNGGETNYIMAATGVYLSLFNIFVSLLHLLMALAGNRD